MALGTPTGGVISSAGGNGTTNVAFPTAVPDSTDCLVLVIGQKPSSAGAGTVTTPSGWTLRGSAIDKGGYGTTVGVDVGNTNLYFYTKDAVSSADTSPATVAVTRATSSSTWHQIFNIPAGTGALSYGFSSGEDTTGGDVSVTGDVDPGFITGDLALIAMCIPTDVGVGAQFSAQAITASGATFATAVELSEPSTSVGNDSGGWTAYASVSSGTSSGAPTVTATAGGTTTNVAGPLGILRIREAAPVSGFFNREARLTYMRL